MHSVHVPVHLYRVPADQTSPISILGALSGVQQSTLHCFRLGLCPRRFPSLVLLMSELKVAMSQQRLDSSYTWIPHHPSHHEVLRPCPHGRTSGNRRRRPFCSLPAIAPQHLDSHHRVLQRPNSCSPIRLWKQGQMAQGPLRKSRPAQTPRPGRGQH